MLKVSHELSSFRVPEPNLNGGEKTGRMGTYNFYQKPDQTPRGQSVIMPKFISTQRGLWIPQDKDHLKN